MGWCAQAGLGLASGRTRKGDIPTGTWTGRLVGNYTSISCPLVSTLAGYGGVVA